MAGGLTPTGTAEGLTPKNQHITNTLPTRHQHTGACFLSEYAGKASGQAFFSFSVLVLCLYLCGDFISKTPLETP
jgi:hypothetical protein